MTSVFIQSYLSACAEWLATQNHEACSHWKEDKVTLCTRKHFVHVEIDKDNIVKITCKVINFKNTTCCRIFPLTEKTMKELLMRVHETGRI